jgi:hypothetical protein
MSLACQNCDVIVSILAIFWAQRWYGILLRPWEGCWLPPRKGGCE